LQAATEVNHMVMQTTTNILVPKIQLSRETYKYWSNLGKKGLQK